MGKGLAKGTKGGYAPRPLAVCPQSDKTRVRVQRQINEAPGEWPSG